VILMGRRTYEVGLEHSPGKTLYAGMKTGVFSKTLQQPEPNGTATIVADDAVEFIRRLKKGEGRDICLVGGGEFAKSLFEVGLVAEVTLNIHPVLLGSGVARFRAMDRQIDLELLDSERQERLRVCTLSREIVRVPFHRSRWRGE
jgi:dihydrofolate reductase